MGMPAAPLPDPEDGDALPRRWQGRQPPIGSNRDRLTAPRCPMAIPAITTALSRALALRLDPGSTYLGGGLQLTFSPIAQASNRVVLPAPAPAGAVATALGLGLGSSRFLARPEEAAFFNSPGLSIITGGGSIAGSADATATTIARNTNRADATATSIGLANLDVITRGGGGLQIGTPGDPLRATASAATRSLLPSGGAAPADGRAVCRGHGAGPGGRAASRCPRRRDPAHLLRPAQRSGAGLRHPRTGSGDDHHHGPGRGRCQGHRGLPGDGPAGDGAGVPGRDQRHRRRHSLADGRPSQWRPADRPDCHGHRQRSRRPAGAGQRSGGHRSLHDPHRLRQRHGDGPDPQQADLGA